MLNAYDLMLLKESNNGEKLIYIQFEKHDFVFRLISPKEYNQAKILTATKEELNDAICQLTLVYPEEFSFVESPMSGYSDIMSEHILSVSLIDDDIGVIDVLEEEKMNQERFITQCILFIKAAFPEYALREIEDWPYEKMMSMTAKAEFIMKLRGCEYEIFYDKEEILNAPIEKTDKELVYNGIDPMFYHSDKIIMKKPFIDYPVIMGASWRDEEIINGVQQQIFRRQNNR